MNAIEVILLFYQLALKRQSLMPTSCLAKCQPGDCSGAAR